MNREKKKVQIKKKKKTETYGMIKISLEKEQNDRRRKTPLNKYYTAIIGLRCKKKHLLFLLKRGTR